MWVARIGGDNGELRPWHYIQVYSIKSRLIIRVQKQRQDLAGGGGAASDALGHGLRRVPRVH